MTLPHFLLEFKEWVPPATDVLLLLEGQIMPSRQYRQVISILSVWGEQHYFPIFMFCVLFGVLLKGVIGSSLLPTDEPLTPNILTK